MDYVLDLLQGLGIAAGIGIRPFLPVLLVGALASQDLGVDFDGTDFSFLEQAGFLLAIVVLVALFGFIERRRGPELGGDRSTVIGLAVIAVVLGVLMACGSIADRSDTWWPGIAAGAAGALLGWAATTQLLSRVRARLDAQTAGALPLYAEVAAVTAAGLSVLLPPLAIVICGLLGWLLVGGRRRAGEKYAGLRILK
jgi:hypothetical protein